MPLTVWIAGGTALVAAILLIAALWFDRLFEARTAIHHRSLIAHLGARSVLAVFAHPDDETLAAGVLFDAGSRDGVEVRTLTLTRGENGHAHTAIARHEDLPALRESELRRYGAVLGIDRQDIWEYPDGALHEAADRALLNRLVETIRTWKPDFVLTFDPAGGYNAHPDHRAAGRAATEAVRLAHDSAYMPALGAAHRVTRVGYVIGPARAFSALGGPELRSVAEVQPAANVSAPVSSALRIQGWRIHASQRLERAYPLPGWLLFDFWDKEHYFLFDPHGSLVD